jgi:hypothetical protein
MMKKILLSIILIIPALYIYSQSPEAEKQSINSRLKSGNLSGVQATQLLKRWNTIISRYSYPQIKIDTINKEIDFSEILSFPNSDKKIIYQRCLQWMAINYFVITYNDIESGKLIGNGFLNLSHFAEYPTGEIKPTQTSVNYTLVLTFKDNKIKYSINDISYSFTNFSEFVDEITYPIYSLFPIVSQDRSQWVKFITLLNETNKRFRNTLKDSLIGYVNDAENDYKF